MPKKNTQEQDYITNKILAVFTICLIGVMALWYVNNLLFYTPNYMLGLKILDVARVAGIVMVIGSIIVFVMDQKQGRSAHRLLSGRNLIVFSVIFTLMATLVDMYPMQAIKAFYAILPALAVYYLIYHSYQPEFFLVATDCGVAAALLLGVRLAHGGKAGYAAAALAVVLAGAQILHAKRHLTGSKLPAGFGANAYVVVSATSLIMALLVIIGAFAGAAAVFYLLCAVAAYVFVLAVYYTVKLM